MDDIVEFIVDLVMMSLMEVKLFAGGIATLAAGALISEFWPFDTDKVVVMNTCMVLAMLLFAGIFLYRRFGRAG